MSRGEEGEIVLPNGHRVPARAGRFMVAPPLNLNEMDDGDHDVFLLEYAPPYLVVRDRALPITASMEFQSLVYQTWQWQQQQQLGAADGFIRCSRSGYMIGLDSSDRQFVIPGCSFVDSATWSRLSADQRTMLYLPCVPTVIELVTEVDTMHDLQAKVEQCIAAGTREAVVVDTREDRMWIHNYGQLPYFVSPLAEIEFDAWPGFTLDRVALRGARLSVVLD